MRFRLFHLALALLALSISGRPAFGVSYVLMSDERLFEQATLIAEVDILKTAPATIGSMPSTDYFALVSLEIKGSARASQIIIRMPGGGAPDAPKVFAPGAPTFRAGERPLLFLAERDDGTFAVLHWALGAFHRIEHRRHVYAMRDFRDADLLGSDGAPGRDQVRDYSAFVRWLTDRAAGVEREPDYFRRASDRLFRSLYSLIVYKGARFRWFEFDEGKTVDWHVNPRNSAGTHTLFPAALNAWNREPGSKVNLVFKGTTASTHGFRRPDGINALIFGDPNNWIDPKFNCIWGGVIAASFGLPDWNGATVRYKGHLYYPIKEGVIVFNDGAECFLRQSAQGAAELFTHHLGHTLGIDDSCGTDSSGSCSGPEKIATMYPAPHLDGRSASIKPDDVAAVRALYEGAGPPAPGDDDDEEGDEEDPEPTEPRPPTVVLRQPTNLEVVSSTKSKVRLAWEDNSQAEQQYEVWIKRGRKKFELLETLPADSTLYVATDLEQGVKYKFKVRSRSGEKTSPFSDKVSTKTSAGNRPAAPSDLRASARSDTEVELSWKDNSRDERSFQLWMKDEGGSWRKFASVDADTTSFILDGAAPGATLSFRVRARGAGKYSEYSNIATLTMPE